MKEKPKEPSLQDKGNVMIIGHITIRDPDSGEVILKKRDKNDEKKDKA